MTFLMFLLVEWQTHSVATHLLVLQMIERYGYDHSIHTRAVQEHTDMIQQQQQQSPRGTVFHYVLQYTRGAVRMYLLRLLIAQASVTSALLIQC